MKGTHYRERGTRRPGTARRASGGTVGQPAAPHPGGHAIASLFAENGAHCSQAANKSPTLLGNAPSIRANPTPVMLALSTRMHFHLSIANMAIPRSRTTTPFDMTPVRHAVPGPGRFAAAAAPGTRGAHRCAGRPCHP
ncbi:hypothetical protein [Burkholderia cepacia]|uniref:hypothetical protein n=1 Tax=Burkholderia cepacia TaxID=292 RepID=UPI001CF17C5D|nr:hypothetical protein [Burkholderia cepacia]MCA8319605.1 hypothetical protein [Burkholderia cepacia]